MQSWKSFAKEKAGLKIESEQKISKKIKTFWYRHNTTVLCLHLFPPSLSLTFHPFLQLPPPCTGGKTPGRREDGCTGGMKAGTRGFPAGRIRVDRGGQECRVVGCRGSGSLGLMVWRDLVQELDISKSGNLRNPKGQWRRAVVWSGSFYLSVEGLGRSKNSWDAAFWQGSTCWSEVFWPHVSRPKINVMINEMNRNRPK